MAIQPIEAAGVMEDTFRDRLFRAWALLQAKLGRSVSQSWLAQRMADELGQASVSQSTISGYFTGKFQPDTIDRWVALAKVLEVDPGWLAFGDDSQAPPPPNPFPSPKPVPRPPKV